MSKSWLLLLAAFVFALATLFATTMTRLARLQTSEPTLIPSPAQGAVPSDGSTPSPAAPAMASATPAKQAVLPAAQATAQTRRPAAADVHAPLPAAASTSEDLRATPPAPTAHDDQAAAVRVQGHPSTKATRAPATRMASTTVPRASERTLPVMSHAETQVARCRALHDYLLDLDREAGRGNEPSRVAWLREQRNTVRARQAELGC